MKRLSLVLFASFLCMKAVAYELTPYLGLNARIRDLGFKKGYGKENFQSKMPEGEVVAGLKVNPYLGFELGYLRNIDLHRKTTTYYPDQNLGLPDYYNLGQSETAISALKIEGRSLNAVGFLPLSDTVQLLGSVGITRFKIKLRYMPIANETGLLTQAEYETSARDFIKSKYIPQAKVGIQYMLTQTVGLKALVGWEDTSRFNLLSNKQGSNSRISLKDSYTMGLGLALYFN